MVLINTFMNILLATNNKGKIKRFKKLLKQTALDIELYTPKELWIESIEIEENGATLAENAELKARAYIGKTNMPILANDTGFYVEGEGLVDAPKRIVFGNISEYDLTKEEIVERLLNFWKGIATKHGGKIDAAWIEAFIVIYSNGNIKRADSRRDVIFTNQEFGKAHIELPVRALYYSKTTNKPAIQHTEEEEMLEMKPVIDALIAVLKN